MKSMLIILSLIVFTATTASAVIDPEDNSMGLYWDLTADTICTEISYVPTNLYLILANPTMDAIGGFEAGFDMEGTAYILSATFANPQSLNVASGFENFIVGFGAPSDCTQATLLVTLSILKTAFDDDLLFFLHESSPSSCDGGLPVILLTNGSLMQVGVSTGPGELTAFMTDTCGSPVDHVSWDSVKSLYR